MKGKVVVVAGTATVAAAEAARLMAAAGANLVLMDRDLRAGHRLTLELNAGNRGIAVFLPGDPADAGDLAEAVAEARQSWGGCDLVLSPLMPEPDGTRP
ncbi:SDR family NAD(P)-dependent oxidoreductase [Rhodospirillum centenum]|uniref:SDR family NAD(P)-dependent oxidoreductase n=1 Tax=Rhodospirillum centenum TaxID=34018 RepID=UPI0005A26B04|nr:SDR family NAD(P)-dependent oxidoreductase [Rhodospirillum centenum]